MPEPQSAQANIVPSQPPISVNRADEMPATKNRPSAAMVEGRFAFDHPPSIRRYRSPGVSGCFCGLGRGAEG